MEIMILLIVLSMVVAGGFLYTFVQLVKNGEYDDLHRPPIQFLNDKDKSQLPFRE